MSNPIFPKTNLNQERFARSIERLSLLENQNINKLLMAAQAGNVEKLIGTLDLEELQLQTFVKKNKTQRIRENRIVKRQN